MREEENKVEAHDDDDDDDCDNCQHCDDTLIW
jgi:hypothetical protein